MVSITKKVDAHTVYLIGLDSRIPYGGVRSNIKYYSKATNINIENRKYIDHYYGRRDHVLYRKYTCI